MEVPCAECGCVVVDRCTVLVSFVAVDDESVFDLDVAEGPFDPTANRAGCYLVVPDVDDWHAQLADRALDLTLVEDHPWGMREYSRLASGRSSASGPSGFPVDNRADPR